MKRFVVTLFAIFALSQTLTNTANSAPGKGELKLEPWAVDYFIKYLKGKHREAPELFIISKDSSWATYYYCSAGPGNCRGSESPGVKICESKTNTDCGLFARGRTVKWKNGINTGRKESKFNSKWSKAEIVAKLTELGFLGETTNTTTKEEKKKETKTAKITTGKRSLAMSWKGYDNLILGSLTFKEEDLVGKINVKLPNNDGNCKGTYALSTEKGTWSLLCANDMSASGTLKWNNQDGSVTGEGKDTKGKVVKFTVEGES